MSIEQWSDLMFPEREGTVTPIYGSVRAINDDGSYEVQLNASSVTTRCAPCCTAMVGDRVLVLIKPNGKCDAIGRLGGDLGGGGTIVTQYDDVSNYIAGRVFAYAGTDEPIGCLLCDGRAVSRTEYWELFAAIGTTYGAGDGSSTFNLPNIESRTIIGESDSYALGSTGGEAGHVLTAGELPAYALIASAHVAGFYENYTNPTLQPNADYANEVQFTGNVGNQPHNNMQPYIVMRYFITTGKGDPVSGINPADYVVDWGTTGNWFWRKYASGWAEAWLEESLTISMTNPAASGYYAYVTFALPFAMSNPRVFPSLDKGGIPQYMKIEGVFDTGFNLTFNGPSSFSGDVNYFIYATGFWKDSPASGGTETIAPTIAERFEALEPVVLYDNASGTTGTITLAETAANFSRIDIMFSKLDNGSGGYNTCRVYDPNGKRASFNQINPVGSASTFQIVFSKIVISGTTITWDAAGCTINVYNNAINNMTWSESQQLIYKIIGYR